MNVLQVENLIRSYRKSVIKESEEDVKVLKGISFQVTEGEFVGIMGKSGCGKTANYAQTECQFRYCGTAIPFLTVRSTAR